MIPRRSIANEEIKQASEIINGALKKIKHYLETPRQDLTTLEQLHEHTRKFALFASLLETQSYAVMHGRSFSSIAETRLKEATSEFNLFVQGNNGALAITLLERTVDLLRKEIGKASLPMQDPPEFENFPGFFEGAWRLCEHDGVYFTRSILRGGEKISKLSVRCAQCAEKDDLD